MTQYLLSVHHDEAGPTYTPEEMERAYRDVDVLNTAMQEAGIWVFAGGLHPPSTATVVRAQGDDFLLTDGPFAEAKEHLGGFWIIEVADLDAALAWAKRATVACQNPVEVRPFSEG